MNISQFNYVQNVLGVKQIMNIHPSYIGSIDCDWLFFTFEKFENENKKLISRIAHSLSVSSYAVVLTKNLSIIENIIIRSSALRFLAFSEKFSEIFENFSHLKISSPIKINQVLILNTPEPAQLIVTYSLKEFLENSGDKVRRKKWDSFSAFKKLL